MKKKFTIVSKASTVLNNKFSSKINFETQRLHISFDEFKFKFSFSSIKEKSNVRENYSFNALFDMSFEKKLYVMKHSNKFILHAKIKLINDFLFKDGFFLKEMSFISTTF